MERRSSKRWLVVAAMSSALPAAALAQSQGLQVFVFGDAGVVAQNDRPATIVGTVGSKSAGTSLSLNSGPWQASRLGFRGKLKLTDDFDAWYDAATTVNLVQGTLGNLNIGTTPAAAQPVTIFDRNAFVGVASKKFGNFTLGRHPTVVTEAIWVTDPLKANNGATNPNVRFAYLVAPGSTIYSNFGTNPGANTNGIALDRQSQSAKYVYGNSGFLGMAMYGLGGATGDRGRNQYVGALLGYDSDQTPSHGPIDRSAPSAPSAFSLRLAGQAFNDAGTNAGNATGTNPTETVVTLYSWTAGAVGRMGPVKAKASYTQSRIDNASFYKNLDTRVAAGGVTCSIGDLDLTAAVYNVNRRLESAPIQDATKLYFVPEYYVTKNFWIYGIADYELMNSAAVVVPTATGTPASVTGRGPIDASGTNGNTLATGVKGAVYIAVGVSFFFNS